MAKAGRGISPRKRVILDAALGCFDAKGVSATTIDDVRVASGASIGSLYHHFGGKDRRVGSEAGVLSFDGARLTLEIRDDFGGAFLDGRPVAVRGRCATGLRTST